mmetsp:Transcript_63645/g.207646  ORF Transcript_63645/g.207646 Transcript_63645/m.207646 type:complete len:211 (+) Transcript_63645:3329-3961(+)
MQGDRAKQLGVKEAIGLEHFRRTLAALLFFGEVRLQDSRNFCRAAGLVLDQEASGPQDPVPGDRGWGLRDARAQQPVQCICEGCLGRRHTSSLAERSQSLPSIFNCRESSRSCCLGLFLRDLLRGFELFCFREGLTVKDRSRKAEVALEAQRRPRGCGANWLRARRRRELGRGVERRRGGSQALWAASCPCAHHPRCTRPRRRATHSSRL